MNRQHSFNLLERSDILAEKIRREPEFVREYLLRKSDETPDEHEYHYYTAVHYAAAQRPESFRLLLEFAPDLVAQRLLDPELRAKGANADLSSWEESIALLQQYLPQVWKQLQTSEESE